MRGLGLDGSELASQTNEEASGTLRMEGSREGKGEEDGAVRESVRASEEAAAWRRLGGAFGTRIQLGGMKPGMRGLRRENSILL